MPDLTDLIETAAQKPASASVGDRSASAVSIPNLIEADKYLKQQEAAAANANPIRMIKRTRIVPPSALGH